MPEVLDGKNVADFIDPDIMAKLDELEAEEERLEAAGFYDDEDDLDSDEDAIRTAASAIRDKKAYIRLVNAQKNKLQNRPIIPRTVQTRTLSDMSKKLTASGYDPTNIEARAKVLAKARGLIGDGSGRKRSAGDMDMDDDEEDWQEDDGQMEVDGEGSNKRAKTSLVAKGKRVPGSDRQTLGLKDAEDATKAVKLKQLYQYVALTLIVRTFTDFSRLLQTKDVRKGQGWRRRSRHPDQDAQTSVRSIMLVSTLAKTSALTIISLINRFSGKRKNGKTNRR